MVSISLSEIQLSDSLKSWLVQYPEKVWNYHHWIASGRHLFTVTIIKQPQSNHLSILYGPQLPSFLREKYFLDDMVVKRTAEFEELHTEGPLARSHRADSCGIPEEPG